MNKVNLFIVGAAKSGTTSLQRYLKLSKNVFVPRIKEPHYFADVYIKDKRELFNIHDKRDYHSKIVNSLKDYNSLYIDAEQYLYKVDASPSYLYDNEASTRIYKYNPDAKIIICLRHPIERAILII